MEYTLMKENGFKGTLILLKNQFKKKKPKTQTAPTPKEKQTKTQIPLLFSENDESKDFFCLQIQVKWLGIKQSFIVTQS